MLTLEVDAGYVMSVAPSQVGLTDEEASRVYEAPREGHAVIWQRVTCAAQRLAYVEPMGTC